MVSRDSLFALAIAGGISYMIWGKEIKERVSMSAEGGADSESHFLKDLIHTVKEKFNPSDLEQLQVERTGLTVDIIPLQYVESASYANHFAIDINSINNCENIYEINNFLQDHNIKFRYRPFYLRPGIKLNNIAVVDVNYGNNNSSNGY